jgi:hypothetical protein
MHTFIILKLLFILFYLQRYIIKREIINNNSIYNLKYANLVRQETGVGNDAKSR